MTLTIYPFDFAPQPLQALSQHGGDEDWVIVVNGYIPDVWWPGKLGTVLSSVGRDIYGERDYIEGWGFVERYEDSGRVVFITAHA